MTSKVFISYRRDDSAGSAGRLHDQLAAEFGREQIAMDVDSFPLGINFVTALREEVGKCDVLLAVIGPNWLNARDEAGSRRLDNLNDFVRTEIATALQRDIPVIPILLDGVKPPQPHQLPPDIQELSLRNALHVRHTSFSSDVGKLVRALKARERAEQQRLKRDAEAHAHERVEQERLKREAEAQAREHAQQEHLKREAEAQARERAEQEHLEREAKAQAREHAQQEHLKREAEAQARERAEQEHLKREAEAKHVRGKLKRIQSYVDDTTTSPEDDDKVPLRNLDSSYDDATKVPQIPAPSSKRPPPLPDLESDEGEYEQPLPPRSNRGLITVATLLLIGLGTAGAAYYYDFWASKPLPSPQTAQAPAPTPKLTGRVPEEPQPRQPPAAHGGTQQEPNLAQRAVLYEADANDPQGKRFAGSTVWRTETVSPGPGLPPEIAVRADIAIPERHMKVTWSLRRNTDKALPASHTIEVMFNLPPNFPGGGIANVPGILMKDSEEVRGMPLAGLAVKVTNGFFLIGLNSADDDLQRNLQLLKERAWFDVLIVNVNNSRSILTMEKGAPGDRAFAEAFKAWGE
jgi:hypothetical protein